MNKLHSDTELPTMEIDRRKLSKRSPSKKKKEKDSDKLINERAEILKQKLIDEEFSRHYNPKVM